MDNDKVMMPKRNAPAKNRLKGSKIESLGEIRPDLFETGVPARGMSNFDKRLKDRDVPVLRMLSFSEQLEKRPVGDHPVSVANIEIDVFRM